MPREKTTTNLTIRIQKDLKKAFEDRCKLRGQVPSTACRLLIRNYSKGLPTLREILDWNNERLSNMENMLLEYINKANKPGSTEL